MGLKTKTGRRVLAAVLAVSTMGLLALGTSSLATASPHAAAGHDAPKMSKRAFHDGMRQLWVDHVTWTRLFIVSFAADLPDLQATTDRLLQNQVDIGNAIKPFYGAAAGAQLTRLLRTHIMEAVPVLSAAKAGQKAKLATALKAWYANAHQIAAFLAKANPTSWPLPEMTKMMDTHLRLTTNEAAAHLKGRWQASIAAYDQVRAEILMMADMLADGIVEQFPARFA